MNRRNFMERTGASIALGAFGASAGSRINKPHNVLIIHADEHNFRTLGCYQRALPEKEARVKFAENYNDLNLPLGKLRKSHLKNLCPFGSFDRS